MWQLCVCVFSTGKRLLVWVYKLVFLYDYKMNYLAQILSSPCSVEFLWFPCKQFFCVTVFLWFVQRNSLATTHGGWSDSYLTLGLCDTTKYIMWRQKKGLSFHIEHLFHCVTNHTLYDHFFFFSIWMVYLPATKARLVAALKLCSSCRMCGCSNMSAEMKIERICDHHTHDTQAEFTGNGNK